MAGFVPIGAELRRDGAANFSPPPCGEGLGVGVARCGTSVRCGTTPHPNPPPQGGRESTQASPQFNFALMGLGTTIHVWEC
jgi:hypothetical protein